MQRLIRATVASVAVVSAALLIGAGTANAATPAATTVLAADTSIASGLGDVFGDVATTVSDLLAVLGISL